MAGPSSDGRKAGMDGCHVRPLVAGGGGRGMVGKVAPPPAAGAEEVRARLAVLGSGSAAGAETVCEKAALQILAKCNDTSL